MTALARRLAARIAAEGPISLAAFTAEALSHPRLGYYMTRDPLGERGDFVTAPEISQMFGELIGLWCAEAWARMGSPSLVRLIELGPGRGTLMADALRAAAKIAGFRQALSVHLVETSPILRDRQSRTLGIGPRWHNRLDDVPDGPALIVANEFFDALPVHQFQCTAEGWAERLVDLEPDSTKDAPRFRFLLGPAFATPNFPANGPGVVIETCPAAQAVARALGARLNRDGGAALIIDYGYAGPAVGDTVQAVRAHAFAPVLEAPGEADITAHVDFAALARAARDSGAKAYGPVDQGPFLLALGLAERAEALKRRATPKQAADIDAAVSRLAGSQAMGRLFKTLALTSPEFGTPAGFAAPT